MEGEGGKGKKGMGKRLEKRGMGGERRGGQGEKGRGRGRWEGIAPPPFRNPKYATVHWFDASCSVTPVNNSITLISPVQSLAGLHFLPLTVYA